MIPLKIIMKIFKTQLNHLFIYILDLFSHLAITMKNIKQRYKDKKTLSI